ncbi:PREDICTED: glycosyltransferase 25 family member [Dufourea novaeangliae]|uniref:Glycosyltransferase 25 family member n=1 Tax=Dufourea novaeangliae TaxID=178035 RepID=A0A154NYF2_DUFNO|nr:PREDICTED: glycosyltransferase 25 family member [Dufourea novaeangliae]KZC04706.1 Glycosyltransferase 25 family member [Dufourea novaeangliae]
MGSVNNVLISFILLITFSITYGEDLKKPTVLVSILVRNKAHTLPYFLTFLEGLNYPKKRIHLCIYSDNNIDNSIEILSAWVKSKNNQYHGIDTDFDEKSDGIENEDGIADWSTQRFLHVINLRERGLNTGRNIWADFVLMLDADVFLTNPDTLEKLISKNETVTAPLLKSDGMYSNFWAGMNADYYYLRTEKYHRILFREETGCFDVPMIHSAVLVNLRKHTSDQLTYDPRNLKWYDGPNDDIITFAVGANKSGVPLFICNDEVYGFVTVPLEKGETITEDLELLTNIKTEILTNNEYIPLSKDLEQYVEYPVENTLGVDNVYMINLLRRPERRSRMHRLFKELGIRAQTVDAVDGRTLNPSILNDMGVEMMPEYADPYHSRPMTMGEVGCFLSHYIIWNEVIEGGYENVIILEDDVRFEPFFRQKVNYVLNELSSLQVEWDLVYLGRKRLVESAESPIDGSKYLIRAAYSYWTLGYILSRNGAKRLVEAKPLKKLIPVDEYLPILSNTHPRTEWKVYYPKRNLIILSTNPLLIHPTHYTGEQGYISDTEDSKIVDDNISKSKEREEL